MPNKPPLAGTRSPGLKRSWDHGGKTRQQRGYGREHERMRAHLMATVILCEECTRQGRVTVGTHADHKVPLAKGGTHARENYQLLCASCHAAKSIHDAGKNPRLKRRTIGVDGWAAGVDAGLVSIWHSFETNWNKATAATASMVAKIGEYLGPRLKSAWDAAKNGAARAGDAFHALYERAVGHSDIPDMVTEIGEWMSRLQQVMVDPALTATQKAGDAFQGLAGLIGDLFGHKAGNLFGALGGLVSAVAPLFGARAPATDFGPNPSTGAIGMASGGSGVFGGRPGVDRNLLSLNGSPIARVSKGEHFSVSPANNNGRALHFDLRGAVMTPDLLRQMNQIGSVAMAQGAIAGASGGMTGMQRRASRQLP